MEPIDEGAPRARHLPPRRKDRIMKLTEARIDHALNQLNAQIPSTQALPENHPITDQLSDVFGDHTFFFDAGGLTIIEPAKPDDESANLGQVIKLASWIDDARTKLAPHLPEYTAVVVELDRAA
ncbi:hypothetical protein J2Y55_003718 [Bosea sp. BE125]|uniref:hypothetical protein n=1 Tax=Bosea sp. BE125 TaxID=2817909 RepID=UPI002856F64E|nr:hypothetical protein [Bosea sp. BE125]MDR6872699.1 hypothetical protein [Bosea sp. BE125]